MKKIFVFLACFLISSPFFAQTSEFITGMLATEKATFGQVCYIAAAGQGIISPSSSETDAVNALFEDATIKSREVNSAINYAEAASIFCRCYKVKGGFFYSITGKSPRYAFKQLKIDGVITDGTNPLSNPTGAQILTLFSNCETKYNPAALTDFDDSDAEEISSEQQEPETEAETENSENGGQE